MDTRTRDKFTERWAKYFPGADLPITFYYTGHPPEGIELGGAGEIRCFIGHLAKVRKGHAACFNADTVICPGGKRYLGFSHELMPGFEYFLSCGIPGQLEGERYKKSPELVKQFMAQAPEFTAPGRYMVFKRWDDLGPEDEPEVVIFFAQADVLSGLFTLANFDEPHLNGVFAPFCAGCGAIVQYPYIERSSERPRGVLGMFDVSARPWVPPGLLSFAVPINKFQQMVNNMDESFLITESWDKVRKRIEKARG